MITRQHLSIIAFLNQNGRQRKVIEERDTHSTSLRNTNSSIRGNAKALSKSDKDVARIIKQGERVREDVVTTHIHQKEKGKKEK